MLFNLIKEVKMNKDEKLEVVKRFTNQSTFKQIIGLLIALGIAFSTAFLIAKYLTQLFIWIIIKTVGLQGFPIIIAILLDITILVVAMIGGYITGTVTNLIFLHNIIRITKEGIVIYHLDTRKAIISKKEFRFPKSLRTKKVKKDLNKSSVKKKISDYLKNKLEEIKNKNKEYDEKIAEFETKTA